MRKCFSLIIVLGLFCFSAVLSRAQPTVREDYSVYAALLKERFITPEIKRLVIYSYASTDKQSYADLTETLNQASPLAKETIDDFRSRRSRQKLTDRFDLPVEINFLSPQEHARFFHRSAGKQDGWQLFSRKYPAASGYIKLSRVGFNQVKSQALLFVAHSCGWLCGEGTYFVLMKKDGEWRIVKEVTTWVS